MNKPISIKQLCLTVCVCVCVCVCVFAFYRPHEYPGATLRDPRIWRVGERQVPEIRDCQRNPFLFLSISPYPDPVRAEILCPDPNPNPKIETFPKIGELLTLVIGLSGSCQVPKVAKANCQRTSTKLAYAVGASKMAFEFEAAKSKRLRNQKQMPIIMVTLRSPSGERCESVFHRHRTFLFVEGTPLGLGLKSLASNSLCSSFTFSFCVCS